MNQSTLQKIIIYWWLLLDVIGIAVLIPAFPDLKTYYTIGDFQVTMGLTIYSLCAFIAAPLLWQLSDRYGRKWILSWCVAGTALSYLVLLLTHSYWVFILSRAINGITGWNISILQAILTDISATKEEKAANFWLMGAMFGLWFIIWPVIWSLLLQSGWVHGIFWGGTLFAIVELILLIIGFRNTNTPESDKQISLNSLVVIGKYFKKERMRPYLISLGLLGMGGFMINATQSLYMNHIFGTSGEQYGYYLAILWIITWLNMALLVPRFWTKKFANRQLIILAHLALIIWYAIVGIVSKEWIFLAVFYTTIAFGNIYTPIYNIEIMSQAHPDEIGEISGMLGGLQSLFMFVWPLIWWVLLSANINVFGVASICCIISIITLYFTHKGTYDQKTI